jgi:hypothetical protein
MDSTRAASLEMALAPNDIARMQSVLDIVDTAASKRRRPRRAVSHPARALAAGDICRMSVGQMSVLITGLLELVRPAPQMAAALGASAWGAAVLRWHDAALGTTPSGYSSRCLLSGAALIGWRLANRGEAPRKNHTRLMAVLAVLPVS